MLSSLGTQAVFLHPADCLHGDLGILCPGHDVVLILSYSGYTSETLAFIRLERVQRCARIAMTANVNSPLAQAADVWLDCSVESDMPNSGAGSFDTTNSEAWPPIPAPTSSTTVMLALGDAFAMGLTQAKRNERATFAENHPGGNLGITLGNM